MTTICWDGETLAADSQAICNFKSDIRKIHRLPDGRLFAGAGAVQEVLAVLEYLRGGEKPTGLENFEAMLIQAGSAAYLGDRLMHKPITAPYAIGSGSQFAIAAMACGKTAAEAVRIAIRFDNGSGGRVESMRLKQ